MKVFAGGSRSPTLATNCLKVWFENTWLPGAKFAICNILATHQKRWPPFGGKT